MNSKNFVVVDVVNYVHCDERRHHGRGFSLYSRRLKRKLLQGMFVALVSGGAGLAAMHFADATKGKGRSFNSSLQAPDKDDLRQRYEQLSDEQKQEIRKRFLGE